VFSPNSRDVVARLVGCGRKSACCCDVWAWSVDALAEKLEASSGEPEPPCAKQRRSLMQRLMIVAIAFALSGSALTFWAFGAHIRACDAECKQASCGSRVVYDHDGRVAGCSKEWFGSNCTGNCHTCTGSTTNFICIRKLDSICHSDTGMPSIGCGTKTYYDCAGTYPGCTCNTGGTGTPSADACSFKTCAA
jgi:hypothetical protein